MLVLLASLLLATVTSVNTKFRSAEVPSPGHGGRFNFLET